MHIYVYSVYLDVGVNLSDASHPLGNPLSTSSSCDSAPDKLFRRSLFIDAAACCVSVRYVMSE